MDLAIQKLLYDLISQEFKCYDYVSSKAEMPYVKLDSSYYIDNSTKTDESITLVQYVNVFSNQKGKKEIRDMVNRINELVTKRDGKKCTWEIDGLLVVPSVSLVRFSENLDRQGQFYEQSTIMYKFTCYK